MPNQLKVTNENIIADIGRLGKQPSKSKTNLLMFADFVKTTVDPPKSYNFWSGRVPFSLRTYGNTQVGNCTIASQVNAARRMERIETGQTMGKRIPDVTDNAVLTSYFNMTWREYGDGKSGKPMPADWGIPNGPGDQGAYEIDALDNWRNAEQTFRDTKNNPITIDAYTRINHLNHMEIKRAIWSQVAKGGTLLRLISR
jgi:hypothetical protein